MDRVETDLVAAIDDLLCDGCRECLRVCPAGMLWDAEERVVIIDPWSCDGCGDCRAACSAGAVSMLPRRAHQTRDPRLPSSA